MRPGSGDVLRSLYKFTPSSPPFPIRGQWTSPEMIDPKDARWRWKSRRPTPDIRSLQEIASRKSESCGFRTKVSDVAEHISKRARTLHEVERDEDAPRKGGTKRAKRILRKAAQTQLRRTFIDDGEVSLRTEDFSEGVICPWPFGLGHLVLSLLDTG